MGKASGSKQRVDRYFMSMHIGVCLEADSLRAIYFGEKLAWSGDLTEGTIFPIVAPDLFGGDTKEGGVSGGTVWLPGKSNQLLPESIANRLGRTQLTCPAFRGIASLFFVGSLESLGGFLWGANNPYLKSIWVKVWKKPEGLDDRYAVINSVIGTVNPVNVIYSAMTSTTWGMAHPASDFDGSWLLAAKTVFDEGLGVAIKWTRQSSVKDFVDELIDHIQATVFVDPETGKWSICLIRGGYDVTSVPVITENDCVLTKFDRKAYGEIINQIVVKWTNPENEEAETVTVQDIASVANQGTVISSTRDYYGIRDAETAIKLANRDLQSSAFPFANIELSANRVWWKTKPGSVIRLYYKTKTKLYDVYMRVVKVDYGSPNSRGIKIYGSEDVFSLSSSGNYVPQESMWQSQSENPRDLAFFDAVTSPYYLLANNRTDLKDDEVSIIVLGSQNGSDTFSYDLISPQINSSGATVDSTIGTYPTLSFGFLQKPLSQEPESNFQVQILNGATFVSESCFMVIGKGEDAEICMVSKTEGQTITVKRGILDTVPKEWSAGEIVKFFALNSKVHDTTIRIPGESVRYACLTRTSKGVLLSSAATRRDVEVTERPNRPYRPANIVVNGIMFGEVDLTATSFVTVSWSRRNRLTEPVDVFTWDYGDVIPEDGQKTELVFSANGEEVYRISAIDGTSVSFSKSSLPNNRLLSMKVISIRGDVESLTGVSIVLLLRSGRGYGTDYGNNYGV